MKTVAAGAFQDGATRHKPDFKRREESIFIAKVGALHRVNGGKNGSMGCRPKELQVFFPIKSKHKIHSRDDGSVEGEKRPQCKNLNDV